MIKYSVKVLYSFSDITSFKDINISHKIVCSMQTAEYSKQIELIAELTGQKETEQLIDRHLTD